MFRGEARRWMRVLITLVGAPSARCWQVSVGSATYSRIRGYLFDSGFYSNTRMSTLAHDQDHEAGGDGINMEEMWPQLAEKQTYATEAAGKVIREAWAADLRDRHHRGEDSNSDSNCWTIKREVVEYNDGDITLEGFLATPEGEGLPAHLPGVILAHTAVGPQEDFMLWKLDAVARLGYAAFALDLFGTGHALWNRAESLAARRPITEDRSLLQSRAAAGVQVLRESQGVDANCLAAVGYCFGGMAVLDLARMSPPVEGLKAVASLHGILVPMSSRAGSSAGGGEGDRGAAPGPRVVVLHASGDPFVPPEQVQAFEEEFEKLGANLEVVKYGGHAQHAFTRPEKTGQADRDAGLSFDAHADADSWRRVVALLREEFSSA